MAIKALKPYTGTQLTVAAFVQYHESLYKEIVKTTPAVLHLETLAPQYAAEITTLKSVIRRVSAYSETTDVAAQDKLRDALLRALFHIFKGYQFIPAGDTPGLAAATKALAPIISTYSGIQDHELNRETVEVSGMLQALQAEGVMTHVEKLELTPLLGLISTANQALDTAMNTRMADAQTRAPQREVNTDQQRRLITDLYNDILATVNAFYLTTREEAISTFIDNVNVIADYYRNVQANTAKKKTPVEGQEIDPNATA